MNIKTTWNTTDAVMSTDMNRIEGNTKELSSGKADGMTFNNNRLQLTAGGAPVGDPIVINPGDTSTINTFITGWTVHSYTANTMVDRFPVPELTSNKTAIILHKNLFLVAGTDYNLDYQANVAILTYTLQPNETIYYMLISSSYNYSDLTNAPVIKNNLTTTVPGNVLDAMQGYLLQESMKTANSNIAALQNRNFIPSTDPNAQQRFISTVPTDYTYSLKLMGLKDRTVMGLTGGGYVHPLGVNAWTDESASAYELMFSFDGMYYRKSNNPTEWGAPIKLATSEEITALQEKISQCMSNAGYGFISEDILTNAGYSQPYIGSANNSATMPNTGQWRVMYIPYVAPSEGYSVQVAYGCVNNDTIWYRKSHGLTWQDWKQVATTHKIDISSKLMGGWKVSPLCTLTLCKIGHLAIVEGIIFNTASVDTLCIDLAFLPPIDNKWHGGSATTKDGKANYFVINPNGFAMFQHGYDINADISVHVVYPIA